MTDPFLRADMAVESFTPPADFRWSDLADKSGELRLTALSIAARALEAHGLEVTRRDATHAATP